MPSSHLLVLVLMLVGVLVFIISTFRNSLGHGRNRLATVMQLAYVAQA
jgi:hypothetical protein